VAFTLPQGDYRFRADLNGTQYWSDEANHCSLPGCETAGVTVSKPVTVTVAGEEANPYPELSVYVFDGDNNYDQPEKTTKDFVVNMKSDILDGFCVPATISQNFGTPKWSPDSKYLILFNIDSNTKGDVVFVNIETQTAYQIAQDTEVIGWIEKP